MYTDFYNLKKQPFNNTPDPHFLFLSPSHEEALSAIIYGVDEKKGLIVATGEVGVGKTTILHAYLQHAEKKSVPCIPIFNSDLSFKELLTAVCTALEVPVDADSVYATIDHLREKLVALNGQGTTAVLIIDEAERMPVETLERLSLLCNLETPTAKLIQIVLAARPELDDILERDELRQLKQRIAIRTAIVPLVRNESFAYITHRLARAEIDRDVRPIFTKRALEKIVKTAQGFPRLINMLCDNALAAGYGDNKKPVDAKLVNKEIIADLVVPKRQAAFPWRPVLSYTIVAFVIFMLICTVLDHFEEKSTQGSTSQPSQSAAVTGKKHDSTASRATRPAAAESTKPRQTKRARSVVITKQRPAGATPAPPTHILTARPHSPDGSQRRTVEAIPVPRKQSTKPPEAAVPEASKVKPTAPQAAMRDKRLTLKDVAVNSAEAKPAEAKPAAPALPNEQYPVYRTVKRGDNLYRLTIGVYGYYNDEMIKWVLTHNPHITDITKISIGETIAFPAPKASAIPPSRQGE